MNGVFTWTPDESYIDTTNAITVRATDLNDTNLTAVQSFNVIVVSPPMMQAVSTDGTNLLLSWSAISGLNYSLQYTTNLAATNWIDLATNVVAAGGMATNSDMLTTDLARFYRVRVGP